MAESQHRYQDSLTPEEKEKLKKKKRESSKAYWDQMSREEYKKRIREMSRKRHEEWSNASQESRNSRSQKISAGRKKYWANMSEEDRAQFGQNHKKWWDSLTPEERRKQFAPLRKGYRKWWDNLSEEEKSEINEIKSRGGRNYWENMSLQEKEKWKVKHNEGFTNYLSMINSEPNRNECAFIEYLNRYHLDYEFQWYNKTKHPDFDKLFPSNSVSGAYIILPNHAWDFIVHTRSEDILVDIDGSIHDPNKPLWEVPSKNSEGKFNIKDLIKFNDSQRPYQTDGMSAYIVQCYDDNLGPDTPVVNVQTSEKMSFKALMALLDFMNKSEKEQKEISNIK